MLRSPISDFVDAEAALEIGLLVLHADQELGPIHDLPLCVEEQDRAGLVDT